MQNIDFIKKLKQASGEVTKVTIPDNGSLVGVFANWRLVPMEQFGGKEALVLDALSISGEPTEMFENNESGQMEFPKLYVSSSRFMKLITPIIETAIGSNSGQIHIKIEKILGDRPTENTYKITALPLPKESEKPAVSKDAQKKAEPMPKPKAHEVVIECTECGVKDNCEEQLLKVWKCKKCDSSSFSISDRDQKKKPEKAVEDEVAEEVDTNN